MKNSIAVFNTEIHEFAELSPTEFLNRVSDVEMIRTSDATSFTFYPSHQLEILRNKAVWDFANGNYNSLNNEFKYFFVVNFPEWLYLFLRYSTWENIERCIEGALTGLYISDPEGRPYMESQLEEGIFKKVLMHANEHFREFESFHFIPTEDWQLMEDLNEDYWEKERLFQIKFDYFFRDYACNPQILPFIYPKSNPKLSQRSIFSNKRFDISIEASYFTSSDWDNLIINHISDKLHRTESLEEPWNKWTSNFVRRHSLNQNRNR